MKLADSLPPIYVIVSDVNSTTMSSPVASPVSGLMIYGLTVALPTNFMPAAPCCWADIVSASVSKRIRVEIFFINFFVESVVEVLF